MPNHHIQAILTNTCRMFSINEIFSNCCNNRYISELKHIYKLCYLQYQITHVNLINITCGVSGVSRYRQRSEAAATLKCWYMVYVLVPSWPPSRMRRLWGLTVSWCSRSLPTAQCINMSCFRKHHKNTSTLHGNI